MLKKAVILLSGGIDSSVCLAIAKAENFQCYALSFDYGQRNRQELISAAQVAQHLAAAEHRIVKCDIAAWGGSALTDSQITISDATAPLANTYVPARNTIFLAMALGWAEALGAFDIFFGANAADYDNYPDCRPDFFTAFANTANIATRAGANGNQFKIHTPLLKLTKPDIIREGLRLGINFDLTFSCYNPTENQPCNQCLACSLREQGFAELACNHP